MIALENVHEKELTLGVRNYLSLGVNNFDCRSVHVATSNGSVVKDSCRLKIVPDTIGICVLTFYNRTDKDSVFIESKVYKVKKLKDPDPRIYRRKSGKLYVDLLLKGEIQLENIEHAKVGCGLNLPVKEFKVLATRKGKLVGYCFNDQPEYNQECIELIKSLEPGDSILFFEIIGMNYYQEYVTLSTMEFEVQ